MLAERPPLEVEHVCETLQHRLLGILPAISSSRKANTFTITETRRNEKSRIIASPLLDRGQRDGSSLPERGGVLLGGLRYITAGEFSPQRGGVYCRSGGAKRQALLPAGKRALRLVGRFSSNKCLSSS